MQPTTFVYSSHTCSPYMHGEYLVKPALENPDDKRILYLPMSEWPVNGDPFESQEFGYSKLAWFLDRFRPHGLRPQPFYWSEGLSKRDLEVLVELIEHAPVVILGGGNTRLGMARYRELGAKLAGDPHLFCRLLHERQARGQLTVGYSAGADQLASIFGGALHAGGQACDGFGLAYDVSVTLHHEWNDSGSLAASARAVPHCAWFGLPNDSGLAVNMGWLPGNRMWQLIRAVIDCSWDHPSDHHHVKTRQGMKIDHFYPDGRHWAFGGGEAMLRVIAPDGSRRGWLFVMGGIYDYDTQRLTEYSSMKEILAKLS